MCIRIENRSVRSETRDMEWKVVRFSIFCELHINEKNIISVTEYPPYYYFTSSRFA